MLPHQVNDEVQPKWLQESGGCVTLSPCLTTCKDLLKLTHKISSSDIRDQENKYQTP